MPRKVSKHYSRIWTEMQKNKKWGFYGNVGTKKAYKPQLIINHCRVLWTLSEQKEGKI